MRISRPIQSFFRALLLSLQVNYYSIHGLQEQGDSIQSSYRFQRIFLDAFTVSCTSERRDPWLLISAAAETELNGSFEFVYHFPFETFGFALE